MPLLTGVDNQTVIPIYIDGKTLPLDRSHLITVRSAHEQRDIHYAQGATAEIAHEAAAVAYRAFKEWRTTTFHFRRDLLLRVALNIEAREDEFVALQRQETSCAESWARFNVGLACRAIREIASQISAECTGELPPGESNSAFCMVFKEPVGPVLAIAPWNASMVLATRALAAPIGAGCSVVFKASELSPGVHHTLVEAFVDAGLPNGVLNQLQARREDSPAVTEALISDPAIRKVEFTGSAAVGTIIGQLSSKYLKPVLMELGGKAPAIVLKDADLERAAQLCAVGAFLHHGQICMSTERIIVVRDVADEFSAALKRAVESQHADGAGSAVSTGVAKRAHSMVADAVKNGASFVAGSNQWKGDSSASLEPTIITGVTAKDAIYAEETFGPSATLYVAEDEDEAIKIANDTPYGLNAAVHSKDMFAALRVAKQLECGQVHIGTMTEYDESTAPIGGAKGSGWGRNNGKYALREFLVTKTISLHDPSAQAGFGSH